MHSKTKTKNILMEIISLLFILLFVYAAVSKLLEYEQFKIQIGQSLLLGAYAGLLAWGVPAVEILISFLLMFPKTRLGGLYASSGLMSLFTLYIVATLYFSENIPCSCGGVLDQLGWGEHLIFNIIFLLLGLSGILLTHMRKDNTELIHKSKKKFIAQ